MLRTALLLVSNVVGCALAHSYFSFDLKTDNGTSVGSGEAFIHHGEWTWELNTTMPLSIAEIADRSGDATNPKLTDLVDLVLDEDPVLAENIYAYKGTFGDESIEISNKPNLFKDERNMTNAQQLAGHMCMGHIFVVANTTDGLFGYGPLIFSGKGDCYNGTKTTSMRMPMGGSAGGAMNHDSGNMDHSMHA